MKYERPCGARRECRRRALRNPRGTTANCVARRECESPISPPYGARREQQGMPPEAPAAQPQTARHGGSAKVRSAHPAAPVANIEGELSATPTARAQTARHSGSVEGSRGAHADGGTRHRASSRRWHRAISPWRGVGSRGATVGRPSAHCASPGRHSGPRSSPPDRATPRAHPPQPRARADERNEQPVRRKAHPPQAPTHRAPPRAHPTQPKTQAVRGRADRRAQRASPDERNEQPAWRKANLPQAPTHRAPPRAHLLQPKA